MKITINPDGLQERVARGALSVACCLGKELGDRITLVTIKAHPHSVGLEYHVICDVPLPELFAKPRQITAILILEEASNVYSLGYLGDGQIVPTFMRHERYPESIRLTENPKVQIELLKEAVYLAHAVFKRRLEQAARKVLADLPRPEGFSLPPTS